MARFQRLQNAHGTSLTDEKAWKFYDNHLSVRKGRALEKDYRADSQQGEAMDDLQNSGNLVTAWWKEIEDEERDGSAQLHGRGYPYKVSNFQKPEEAEGRNEW